MGKVSAVQAWDLGSDPQHCHKKAAMAVCACNPLLGRQREEGSQGSLISRSSRIIEFYINERPCVKDEVEGLERWRSS